jgi:hypothetical protein
LLVWFDILLLFLCEVFMSKITSRHVQVYEMMKSGKSVSFDSLVTNLGCKPSTVMALIFGLRRHAGGEIDTERNGRKVESYKLTNAADIATKMVTAQGSPKTKTPKVKSTKTKTVVSRKAAKDDEFDVPTLDADLDITEVSDAELADLRNQLGLA